MSMQHIDVYLHSIGNASHKVIFGIDSERTWKCEREICNNSEILLNMSVQYI